MDLQQISERIEDRKPRPLGISNNYSVLLPLIYVDNELHILYQVRSQNLDTQPGEISFPGGRVEKGESFKAAAVRETCEELQLDNRNINMIGQLDYIVTPYNFIIYTYAGILENTNIDKIDFSRDEVDEIFTVPLKFFIENEPLIHSISLKTDIDQSFPYHLIQNGEQYNWRTGKYPVYFYLYNDYIIWGMTARITKNFIDIIK